MAVGTTTKQVNERKFNLKRGNPGRILQTSTMNDRVDAGFLKTSGFMINSFRIPFVMMALLCLLLGLWTGLNRIGWNFGTLPANAHHGAIMVGGFLGTLISLEKIIPLKKKILFVLPAASAMSALCLALGFSVHAFILLIVASAGLSVVFLSYLLREKNLIYLIMTAGALCWLTGNVLLFTTRFYPMAFPWWVGFALLIITAERIELMKFLPVAAGAKKAFVLLLAAYVAGVVLSFHGAGRLVSGASLIAISLWLIRYDLIGVTIRKQGLPGFVAAALLCGYLAMLLTGIFFIALRGQAMEYDAIIHTFFLGFVFSMIFAHGPIILPGVLGIQTKPYHAVLYAWLILLHLSWIMRIGADVFLDFHLRRIAAIITAIILPLYFMTLASLIIIHQRRHAQIL
jgi:hypothetical protein